MKNYESPTIELAGGTENEIQGVITCVSSAFPVVAIMPAPFVWW